MTGSCPSVFDYWFDYWILIHYGLWSPFPFQTILINLMNNSGLLTYIQLQPIMFKNKSYDAFLQGLHNQIDNLYRIKFPETSDKFMIFATIPRHVILPEFVISQVVFQSNKIGQKDKRQTYKTNRQTDRKNWGTIVPPNIQP